MSTVSGIGSGIYNPFTSQMQQLQSLFDLFNAGGPSGTGSNATTTSSDPLLGLFGAGNTGDLTTGAATSSLAGSMFSDQMGMMLIDAQAQQSGAANGSTGGDPMSQFAQALFSQIDSNGNGSISKSELESAVTAAGGTVQAADALYAQLDPNNTGSVSEQGFAQALGQTAGLGQPSGGVFRHHHHHMGIDGDGDGGANSSSGGNNAQDALAALLGSASTSSSGNLAQNLFSQIDTNGTGSITQSELENAVTAAGGTKAAADALFAQLDPNNTGSVLEASFAQALQPPSPSGNTAQDAILALLNAPAQSTATATATTTSTTTGTDTGNTAQDAWWALLNGGGTGSNATTSPTTTSPADLNSALSLSAMLDQSYQLNQQLYGLYANGGMGF